MVEADETYFGKREKPTPSKHRRGLPYAKRGAGPAGKRAIFSLVERSGDVRTFHIANADRSTVEAIVARNVDKESRFHTDESNLYLWAGDRFAAHETVKHSAGEYVRGG